MCDRLLLMGCLEQLHHFGEAEVSEVISDIQQEFEAPISANLDSGEFLASRREAEESLRQLQNMDERLAMLEDSVISTLELVKQVVSLASAQASQRRTRANAHFKPAVVDLREDVLSYHDALIIILPRHYMK